MTNEEAIEAIKCNWPDSRYTILREALDMAISALRQQEHFRDLTKNVEPLTNAQKIRAMSDEELANIVECPYGNPYFDEHLPCKGSCRDCLLIWLQQPAEEDEAK